MIQAKVRSLPKYQVDVLYECIDLIQNGYRIIVDVRDKHRWFLKLRHLTNGRILILQWWEFGYSIREGSKILKSVPN